MTSDLQYDKKGRQSFSENGEEPHLREEIGVFYKNETE